MVVVEGLGFVFEMGGDETPGLTDFQNSAWINEDADSIYRTYDTFEQQGSNTLSPSNTSTTNTSVTKNPHWDDLGSQEVKKKDASAEQPKAKNEKSTGNENKRSGSSRSTKASTKKQSAVSYESSINLGYPTGYDNMNSTLYGTWNRMNSNSSMNMAYGMYNMPQYNVSTPGKQPQQTMQAYQQYAQSQYQYQYQYQQYQYQQYQYQQQQLQQQPQTQS